MCFLTDVLSTAGGGSPASYSNWNNVSIRNPLTNGCHYPPLFSLVCFNPPFKKELLYFMKTWLTSSTLIERHTKSPPSSKSAPIAPYSTKLRKKPPFCLLFSLKWRRWRHITRTGNGPQSARPLFPPTGFFSSVQRINTAEKDVHVNKRSDAICSDTFYKKKTLLKI